MTVYLAFELIVGRGIGIVWKGVYLIDSIGQREGCLWEIYLFKRYYLKKWKFIFPIKIHETYQGLSSALD